MNKQFTPQELLDAATEAVLFARDGIPATIVIDADDELQVIPSSDVVHSVLTGDISPEAAARVLAWRLGLAYPTGGAS